jgi:transcriptional regulator with XRE-family HTH domain
MTDGRKKPRLRKKAADLPRVSKEILSIRIASGLTQEKAAEMLGISPITLSRLERGDLRISARGLEKILNFFDMTIAAVPRDDELTDGQKGDNYEAW